SDLPLLAAGQHRRQADLRQCIAEPRPLRRANPLPREQFYAADGTRTSDGACCRHGSLRRKESDMTGILDKFHVEHGVHGAKVMAQSHQLTSDCTNDSEVDSAIE